MIDLETIDREIDKIERTRDTTYATCERLAWLYVCRDHLVPRDGNEQGVMPKMRGSEFLELCSGRSVKGVMAIMDEYMQTLAITYPTTYRAVMDKILGTQ